MDLDDVNSAIPRKIFISGVSESSVLSQGDLLNNITNTTVKVEGIPNASSDNISNRRSIMAERLINTSHLAVSVDGACRFASPPVKLLTNSANSAARFILSTSSGCINNTVTAANPVNSKRIPVKLLVAEGLNSKLSTSVNTLKLSPGTVLKGGQQVLMCLANASQSVANRVNKVALVPAQNLTFIGDSSPKKVAVISIPVKQPLGKTVVGSGLALGSAANECSEIDLGNSSVKVETTVQPKVILQPARVQNPAQIQVINSDFPAVEQLQAKATSSLMQPMSHSTTISTSCLPHPGQVKFVKLLTLPSADVTQKQNDNRPVLKPSISPLRLIIPQGQTLGASQAAVSSATSTAHLSLAQAKALPPRRLILPSPWKPLYDHNVSSNELKSAVAQMTKQAALTIRDIQQKNTSTDQIKVCPRKVSNISSKSRKLNDSGTSISAFEQTSGSSGAYVSSNAGSSDGICVEKSRRPCNCSKSQCLKLYCECFANGEFCSDCNCINCTNNLEHEDDRQRAIRACLDRNPFAFHPKIGKSREGDASRQHSKGCHCRRSSCLKNYCECYEAKILCTDLCKCYGCKNFETNIMRKSLMHLADAADKRAQQQLAATNRLNSEIDYPSLKPTIDLNGKRQSHSFITLDVVEATNACLLATAEECMAMFQSDRFTERQILEEFGRCLEQVIDAANRS